VVKKRDRELTFVVLFSFNEYRNLMFWVMEEIMAIEIERKFLVNQEAWAQLADKGEGKYYAQAYIHADPNKSIRIRISEGTAILAIKGSLTNLSRLEFEYEIPLDEAEMIMKSLCGAAVVKRRYIIHHTSMTWEVDVFEGENEGLIIAEIELEAEDQFLNLPPWVQEEVTDDPRYLNANLSKKPYATW